MAKALFGHVGIGTDLRLAAEVRRLRARVTELEGELFRAQEANEVLNRALQVEEMPGHLLSLDPEPALTH